MFWSELLVFRLSRPSLQQLLPSVSVRSFSFKPFSSQTLTFLQMWDAPLWHDGDPGGHIRSFPLHAGFVQRLRRRQKTAEAESQLDPLNLKSIHSLWISSFIQEVQKIMSRICWPASSHSDLLLSASLRPRPMTDPITSTGSSDVEWWLYSRLSLRKWRKVSSGCGLITLN